MYVMVFQKFILSIELFSKHVSRHGGVPSAWLSVSSDLYDTRWSSEWRLGIMG